ncbi:hypothetical protein A1O3_09745 [Capronia epimyces CBS 606.96]|uniref:Luciferase domain-containing protein n=1 Tax=Capronia epimyces CBS 606.96 TaxID=1182542 RepID=W9XBC9_9EURO|nr:uncharacterized protein A1O3_09745 [Capronia epimyces CBS 606.96]EXJ77518.1 hypothetical protein A1O3_09745 [Capronia epimyces CBS 606.96]
MAVSNGCIPPLFYAVAFILMASALITYVLGFVNLDITPLLHSEQGKAVQSISHRIYERLLKPISVSDPTIPPSIPASLSSRGYLEPLLPRSGSRPAVSGTCHPKQITQLPCLDKEIEVPGRLQDLITAISVRHPRTTYLGSSTFEADGPVTLFARHRVFDETRYYGEILRADRSSGLIQCTLHPHDVKAVVEKGWGQRHPLSTRLASWLAMSKSHPGRSAETRVVLYAPRSQNDMEVVNQVIHAAVWWVGGLDSRVDDEKA